MASGDAIGVGVECGLTSRVTGSMLSPDARLARTGEGASGCGFTTEPELELKPVPELELELRKGWLGTFVVPMTTWRSDDASPAKSIAIVMMYNGRGCWR